MKYKIIGFLIAVTATVSLSNAQENFKPNWQSLNKHNPAPDWFSDAKLGVYFHWGVYNVPANGNEWYGRFMYDKNRRKNWGKDIYDYHTKTYGREKQYHDFIPEWKGEQFSAKEWVDKFEHMGAKFIGTIAEHHDGFSLWESKVNPWNSKDMGPKIDVVKEIATEVKKRDLKFMTTFHHGFHMLFFPKKENSVLRPVSEHIAVYKDLEYPQGGKYNILYGNTSYKEECDIWLEKLNEVIAEYCPDYIWMDFAQGYVDENYRQQFLANYFNKAAALNKEVVVNTKGDFFPTDLAIVNLERATMEDITPFVWVTDFQLGSSWGYNKDKRTAINPKKAIRILAEVVSKNGVMILAAAPMAEGIIPEEQVAAMEGIGNWLGAYGEAIYNTRPFVEFGQGPTKLVRNPNDDWNAYGAIKAGLQDLNDQDIRYTKNGNTVYAIQLGWPGSKKEITLNTFAGKAKDLKIKSVKVLGSRERIQWKKTSTGLQVTSPKKMPKYGEAAIVYKIILK
ncbi:alpha-L-fucosidase [Wenyingzhuangia heitensis]|uniref:alpha-L-fucosidase n=1 Tax=Wenyingzhuangia heitensis TaxID=1487859 RepID=A0ABX0UFX8_9FLAO|nr:alpha-L-fucosidase [Wenyingzhuangia heitensis]NIJ45917.1 alpha-L-fucosidase [Wenyingzhuangia heitensis]